MSEPRITCTVWDCPRCEGLSWSRCEHDGGEWVELVDIRALDAANARADEAEETLERERRTYIPAHGEAVNRLEAAEQRIHKLTEALREVRDYAPAEATRIIDAALSGGDGEA